jgi:chaperone required for assembly of F1-ATPase
MKRFWDQAAIAADPQGWHVMLDGKPVRLPGGPPLLLPHRNLAEAVAAEWTAAGGAKGGEMSYADLPLTRLAGTAQERIAIDPEPVVLELARYAETDLLCYRAESPAALVRRQQAEWQPWVDWAERRHGARLRVTSGIAHVAQDPATLMALAQAAAAHSIPAVAALGIAVPALGSLVLGLAMADGDLDADTAARLSLLDELFQEEQWGSDPEATARRDRVTDDIRLAGRFLALLRQPDHEP